MLRSVQMVQTRLSLTVALPDIKIILPSTRVLGLTRFMFPTNDAQLKRVGRTDHACFFALHTPAGTFFLLRKGDGPVFGFRSYCATNSLPSSRNPLAAPVSPES